MHELKPVFPLTVLFEEDGESWVMEDKADLENNLPWLDSGDKDEEATVTDARGRSVVLIVENLELKKLEYKT